VQAPWVLVRSLLGLSDLAQASRAARTFGAALPFSNGTFRVRHHWAALVRLGFGYRVKLRSSARAEVLFHLERDNQDHIRDVRCLPALSTTQRYIEADVEAQRKLVNLI